MLAAQVEGLVNGTLTTEQFEAATTPDAVRQQIDQVPTLAAGRGAQAFAAFQAAAVPLLRLGPA